MLAAFNPDGGPMTDGGRRGIAACAVLLTAFAILAASAVATKSPTMDEPTHALSGWLALREGDYRLEVTNPALWKMWAAIGDVGTTPPLDRRGPIWGHAIWAPAAEMPWVRRTLFDTPGTDGGRFVGRARAMMLAIGVGLGATVAAWAYRLGGPVAAVAAAGLFAFDPTLLAHAPLVKSDVAVSLALVGLGWATWRVGQQVTAARVLLVATICGVAVNVKLTGLLAGPTLAVLLVGRALGPTAWPAFGWTARTRPARLALAIAVGLTAALTCVAVTWGAYRCRFRPASDPAVAIDMPAIYDLVEQSDRASGLTGTDPMLAFGRWANDHRLLPQAFVAGLLNQTGFSRRWPAYLDGQIYTVGRWEYYPLAVAYKTPLAELTALAAAAAVVVGAGLTRPWRRPGAAWAGACVAVPAGLFALAAVNAPLNAGLRSVLPLYAFAYVAAGVAAGRAWQRWPARTAAVGLALLGAQAVAAVTAWPDYIPFFNAAVGGSRAGAAHLADANLDWGQDIPALVAWQRDHPEVPLYADLFTAVDPAFYGLRYQKVWERTPENRPRLNLPDGAAVLAVSVTHLQGMYLDPAQRPLAARLAAQQPFDVLHGSIYLFRWPLP